MSYVLDLNDAWAKLERGREHASRLRSEIESAGAPDYRNVQISRGFDPTSSCMVYRVARSLDVMDHWGPIAGDAIHNFRCSLDYLAWQLALRFYDGLIPDKVARQVYFPIVYKEDAWPNAHKHMSADDAAKIESSQPFQFANKLETTAVPLDVISKLSNADKHRKINIISTIVPNAQVVNDGWPSRDSVPLLNDEGDMIVEICFPGADNAGEEILRLHIVPTGPNPDVEVNLRLTREVVFSQDDLHWPVIPALYYAGFMVEKILNRFDPNGRPESVPEEFPGQTILSTAQ